MSNARLLSRIKESSRTAYQLLESCSICPRKCAVNRLKGEIGFCKSGLRAKVFSHMPHMGEEPPISGERGSGTIFFSNCNMGCVYCQNYEFSQQGRGREVEAEELASIMLELQGRGCHNINFVSPTHFMPQILVALEIAISKGLSLPLVYNTGGYELPEIVRILEGIVDVYLPDMRYADGAISLKYSQAPDYPQYNQAAVKEMHRQAGLAEIGPDGMVRKGLIVRHLVLPNGISQTKEILRFIAQEISPETYLSLMSQYLPYHRAGEFPVISRRLREDEYEEAKRLRDELGLYNGWTQESYGLERFAGVNIKPSLL